MSRHFSEDAVASFLSNHGYAIVGRNVLLPTGEVDIIASRARLLVFVEVRYRRYYDPAETIDGAKVARLIKSALLYTGSQHRFRIDVFACAPEECTWYKGVSGSGDCQSVERVDLW